MVLYHFGGFLSLEHAVLDFYRTYAKISLGIFSGCASSRATKKIPLGPGEMLAPCSPPGGRGSPGPA